MREKRKSEKAIFEAKDLVILNLVCYNVLVQGKVCMGIGGNSETDGARPPPSMELEQLRKNVYSGFSPYT